MRGAAKKILLADDNLIQGLATQNLLNKFGYEATVVNTGENAIQTILKDPSYNLVLMDIDLGEGANGIDFAERILSNTYLPIIFFSAHPKDRYVKELSRVRNCGFLPKFSDDYFIKSTIDLTVDLFEEFKLSRQNESNLNLILNSFADIIFTLDTNQRHTKLFGKWIETSGLSENFFLGKSSREILGAPACIIHEEANQKALQGNVVTYNWEGVMNNKKHYYQTTLSPIYTKDKIISGVVGIGRDITIEKENEQKLNKQSAWSKFISEAIITTDTNLVTTEWSGAATAIYGWSEDEAVGKNIDALLNTKFVDSTAENAQNALLEKGSWTGHLKQKTRDNKTLHIESSVTWLKDNDGHILGGIAVNRDITEKIKNLERIKESDIRYKDLLINIHSAVIVHAPDTTILLVNQKASELLGVHEDNLKGKSAYNYDWPLFSSTGKKLAIEEYPVNIILSTKSSIKNLICGIELPQDKKLLWVLINGYPTFHNGTITEVVITFSDITELKRTEEKLNSVLGEKELILHEVHHRVKNNMNTMSSLLSLQANALTNKEVQTILHDSVGRIKSMGVLYDKLYRSDNVEELNIKNYLLDLVDEIRKIFIGKEINFENSIDDLVIPSKQISFIGIIVNELVTNGIKHAFPNQSHGTIKISLKELHNEIKLTYKDNGIGLTPDNKTKHKGFGMNLINLLTRQLKGTIQLTGDSGVTIEIRFPKTF